MDFWELTKLLFRRWYISVPMLLLSAVLTAFAGASVKPDYQATSHLQLLPPLTTSTDVVGKPRNPWNDLGIGSLGNAIIIGLGDQTVLDSFKAQGLSPSFTVTMDPRTPVMTIEAVAPTPQQAIDSARAVQRLIDQQVLSLQQAYGAPSATLITTRGLDAGSNVTKITSKMKRALAVIGGVGLLLTSAVTIGADAVLRSRARKRSRRLMPRSPVDLAWTEAPVWETATTPRRGRDTDDFVQADASPLPRRPTPVDRIADPDAAGDQRETPRAGRPTGQLVSGPVSGVRDLVEAEVGGDDGSNGSGWLTGPAGPAGTNANDSDATIILPADARKDSWGVNGGGGRRR